jgi:hypothetical protein
MMSDMRKCTGLHNRNKPAKANRYNSSGADKYGTWKDGRQLTPERINGKMSEHAKYMEEVRS